MHVNYRMRVFALAAGLAVALATPACERQAESAAAALNGSGCAPGARFSAELYGSLATELDWQGDALACEGMRRPRDAGARLRFAGPVPGSDGERRLAFIVALPDLERGQTGEELPATVTLIEEDEGRFFTNGGGAGEATCWSDVATHEAVAGETDAYTVGGIVYCLTPLVDPAGDGAVTLAALRYRGRVDWRQPD